jgi:hypothetical protein
VIESEWMPSIILAFTCVRLTSIQSA